MPRTSKRAKQLRELEQYRDHLVSENIENDDSETEESLFFASAALEDLESRRYTFARRHVPKSGDWRTRVLRTYDEDRGREFIRMKWSSFDSLLEIIKEDPIFFNNSKHSQRPVRIQLLVALQKLGRYGNATSKVAIGSTNAIGDGSVHNYVKRVIEALFNLRFRYIRWPTAAERKRESTINALRAKGLDGCVGKVDGCAIDLAQKPGIFIEKI